MKKKTITAVDMYCGAGGTDEGLRQACEQHGIVLKLIAVNHWEIAIATHTANHSDADHLCANLDTVDPLKVVPEGKLDLLIASPECIYHSNARGGKPINDQGRASAWRIVEWLSKIQVDHVLIENVPEFRGWGPLIEKKVERELTMPDPQMKFEEWYAKTRRHGGTLEEWKRIYRDLQGAETSAKVKRLVKITVPIPDPKRKGEIYISFLKAIESHGYTVETRILNAADFGDPTSRERLFIQARRGRKPIRWPEPTHAPAPKAKANGNGNGHRTLFDMSSKRQPYRTAREIIDWSIPSQSIFTRPRPLSPNTLARIWAGLQKFYGWPLAINPDAIEFFDVTPLRVSDPRNSFTRDHLGAVQPFLVKFYGGHDAASLDEPLPAITANYEHYGLAEPFIVELRGGQDGRSIDEPLTTIATSGAHHALCQPFVMVNRNNNSPKSIDEPLPTLCTGNHMYLINPFIIPVNHGKNDKRSHSVDEPMPTITSVDAWGVIQPFIMAMEHGGHVRSIDKPLNTITTAKGGAHGLVQPFIIKTAHKGANGSYAYPLDSPLSVVTGQAEHALIQPYLVKYNGTAGAQSVDDPLDTVTAKDRFGLVTPELQPGEEIALLDIHFRMLQPHELAAAMGFPKTYVFMGNREQRVKQIGNAVAVNLAQALCSAILSSE